MMNNQPYQPFSAKESRSKRALSNWQEFQLALVNIENQWFYEVEKMEGTGTWEISLTKNGDLERHTLAWSESLYILYGYEPYKVEPTMELFAYHVEPRQLESVVDAIKSQLSLAGSFEVEHDIVIQSGERRRIIQKGKVVLNSKGERLGILGITQLVREGIEN